MHDMIQNKCMHEFFCTYSWMADDVGMACFFFRWEKNRRQDDVGEDKQHHDCEVGEDILVDFVGAQTQRRVDRAGEKRR